jgi:cyclopropane fatty-acyl-phospholipid synthase-like methyltransferase
MQGKKKVSIIKLLLHKLWKPTQLWQIYKLQKNRKHIHKVYGDAELKLYHQIMPGDFLHYGYFEDPQTQGGEISLHQFYRAQLLYATKILDLVTDTKNAILDVGCGMGGLLKLMNDKQWHAIGVTPDANQVQYIGKTYNNKVHACKFEDMPTTEYQQYFGTIITSESLQYLHLPTALPVIQQTLKAGGKWIACDYFRLGEATEKSGHDYNTFLQLLDEHGFAITFQQDITPHILPTLSFVHIWATQVCMPLVNFGAEKIQTKAPGIHYAIKDAIPEIFAKINKNVEIVNPTTFAKQKQYLLMVIERK